MRDKIWKHSRWVLIFSLFYGSMMVNPVEGRILKQALEGSMITEELINFVMFLLFIAGLLLGGFFIRSLTQARKAMLLGSAAFALGLASCLLPPTILWVFTLPVMSMMIGAWLAGYGYYFKTDCLKGDQMKVAAGMLVGSDLMYLLLNLTTNLLPAYGRVLAQILLLSFTFILLMRLRNPDPEMKEQPALNMPVPQRHGRLFGLLWAFIFLNSMMVGMLFQLVVPGYTEVSPIGAMFFNVPYILCILLVVLLSKRISMERWLYIGLAMLGASFLYAMIMSNDRISYLVQTILFQGGVGILYLYWWTIIGKFLLRTRRPALVFAVGLTADSLGYAIMEMLFAAGLFSSSTNGAPLAGIMVMLLAVILLPVLYKGLSLLSGPTLELERFGSSRQPDIRNPGALDSLSSREKVIVSLLLKGYTHEMIAKELQISRSTVKTHVANIYAKMEVRNKAQLIQVLT